LIERTWQQRMAVERAFGLLTVRWMILSKKVQVYDQLDIINIVTSCCVFQNVCICKYKLKFDSVILGFDMSLEGVRTNDGIIL
jgi:hypothetical protein